jgi:ribonucleotide reductase alpha subunit
MYNRRVLAGEFTVVNKHLLRELTARGIWTENVRNRIIAENGSIQNVPEIPVEIREIFKTVWEIPQRAILDMAADRAPYICQSQSLNVHIADPNSKKLTSMHFYAWQKGLKTGMYYLRTRPKADAIKFTVDQEQLVSNKMKEVKLVDKENSSNMVTPPLPGATAMKGTQGLTTEDEEDMCLSCGA